ncbi:sulfotransferase family protein [mine drainage metagenome]|uniref:Sulfotransferase family protein n=1 Tax=mine drainage metagenome TaxID=410659 RepID=A0A1J5P0F1_9ZZZZ
MINQYFKFGFVRNPYDRFISYYFFTQQPKNILQAANIDRLKNILNKTNIEKTILLRPQHKFLINDEGLLVLDFIGKVETFKEDLYTVFGKLNLPEPQYYQINQSKHFNYLNYYDEELIDMINYYYKYDFELLKYPFAEKIKENKIFQERPHK